MSRFGGTYATLCKEQPGFKSSAKHQTASKPSARPKRCAPDLVLLDVGLPTIDESGAGRRIREVGYRVFDLFGKRLTVETWIDPSRPWYAVAVRAGGDDERLLHAQLPGILCALLDRYRHPIEASRHHEVVFFAHDSTLVESFARLVAGSLKADQAAIVLATEPHRDGIAEWLRREDIDVDAAIQRGTYISQDAAGTLSRSS
jgi:hypothetical protein